MRLYLLLFVLILSSSAFGQKRYVVTHDLNFRNTPNLNNIPLDVLQYKDSLIEIKTQNEWSNVVWNTDTGWVWTDYITDEVGITEYFEVNVKSGAVCNDGTIQRKISTNNVCKYNGGLKNWIFSTYVFKNGRKQFELKSK